MLRAARHDRAERLQQAVVAESGEHILRRSSTVCALQVAAPSARTPAGWRSRAPSWAPGRVARGPRPPSACSSPRTCSRSWPSSSLPERRVDRVAGERGLVGGREPPLEAEQPLELRRRRWAAAPAGRASASDAAAAPSSSCRAAGDHSVPVTNGWGAAGPPASTCTTARSSASCGGDLARPRGAAPRRAAAQPVEVRAHEALLEVAREVQRVGLRAHAREQRAHTPRRARPRRGPAELADQARHALGVVATRARGWRARSDARRRAAPRRSPPRPRSPACSSATIELSRPAPSRPAGGRSGAGRRPPQEASASAAAPPSAPRRVSVDRAIAAATLAFAT